MCYLCGLLRDPFRGAGVGIAAFEILESTF